jgi:hypothetical protein
MDSDIEEKHEEEHEDSKKERKVRTTNLNPLEAVKQKEWKEVVMKNNVCQKL